MPRPTPEQLQEAKRRKAEERRQLEEQERIEREQDMARAKRIDALKDEHAQLDSFVTGVYEELSKLNVKWPNLPVSKLQLEQTNRAIRQLKEVMKDEQDEFVEDIHEFVPAGDLPEARDVVLVLRQIKQTLKRLENKYQRAWRGY